MAASGASANVYKLFVANLPWTISSTELKQFFSQFGPIYAAKVVFNRETGMSKHFGFIECTDENTYHSILSQPKFILEGKFLTVKHTIQ